MTRRTIVILVWTLALVGCDGGSTTPTSRADAIPTSADEPIEVGIPYEIGTGDFTRTLPPDEPAQAFLTIVSDLPAVRDALESDGGLTVWADEADGTTTYSVVHFGRDGCDIVVLIRDSAEDAPQDPKSSNCGSYDTGSPLVGNFTSDDGLVRGTVATWQADAAERNRIADELRLADWSELRGP